MPKVAEISINNSRNEGTISSSGNESDKRIVEELQKINESISGMLKQSKQESIFGGGEGSIKSLLSAGGIINLLKTLGLTGTAALGAVGAGVSIPSSAPSSTTYEKALVEGEEKILEINRFTGEILDVLSKQEAIDKGILDEKGNIKLGLQMTSLKWEESTKELTKYKDQIILSVEKLAELSSLETRQKELQEAINEALTRKLKQLNGSVPSSGPARAYSSDSGIGFNDTGQGYSSREPLYEPATKFQPYDNWWKTSNTQFTSSMYKSP